MTDTQQVDGSGASISASGTTPGGEVVPPTQGGAPRGPIAAFDRWVDERVAEPLRGNSVADRVFYTASALGDHGLIWLILADIHALGAADRWPGSLRLAGALGVESVVVNGPVKWMFRRQRPELRDEARLPLRTPRTSSFPSGHATSAFCAATLLSETDPRRRAIYFTVAAVVAWSRVHVRLHHASDVIGGAAIGTLLGVIAKRLVPLGRRPAPGPG